MNPDRYKMPKASLRGEIPITHLHPSTNQSSRSMTPDTRGGRCGKDRGRGAEETGGEYSSTSEANGDGHDSMCLSVSQGQAVPCQSLDIDTVVDSQRRQIFYNTSTATPKLVIDRGNSWV